MPKKLLVIDDQTGITKVVEMIARQLGLNARSINNSALATETFIAFEPDVLMLDMIMPEKDGIDVPSLEMVKWFDSNYHYVKPTLQDNQTFTLSAWANPVAACVDAAANLIVLLRRLLGFRRQQARRSAGVHGVDASR